MKIAFCIQCHMFERRLAWQLSSIAQQVNPPEITIDVAYMPHKSEPPIEHVLDSFNLTINRTVIEDRDTFALRGLVRNIQTEQNMDADWLVYADCDIVYHPEFFRSLADRLVPDRATYYSRPKYHTTVNGGDAASRLVLYEPMIHRAYARALEVPRINKTNKPVAAGCCQIVKPEWTDGYYVKNSNDRHLFDRGQKARSDIRFRRRIGPSIDLDLQPQVTLNHTRDKEIGHHTEAQR